jgi:hypothetical protein
MPAAQQPRRATTQRTPQRPAPQQAKPDPEPEPQADEAQDDQFSEEEDPFNQSAQSEEVDQDSVFDLSGTPDEPDRELLPPGIYDATISNVEFGNSRRSGNPMLTWIFDVVDKQGANHTLFYHTVLNDERGLVRAKKAISRILTEEDGEFDWANFKPGEVADWAVGRACRVIVRIQPATAEYDKSNSIRDVLTASEGFIQ